MNNTCIDLDNQSQNDWWDKITIEERASIIRGLSDLEKENLLSHDEVRKNYERWMSD